MARGRPKKLEKILPKIKEFYIFSLTFGDKVYEGSGVTILEALQSTPIPIKIVTKGLLKLTDGVRKLEETWIDLSVCFNLYLKWS